MSRWMTELPAGSAKRQTSIQAFLCTPVSNSTPPALGAVSSSKAELFPKSKTALAAEISAARSAQKRRKAFSSTAPVAKKKLSDGTSEKRMVKPKAELVQIYRMDMQEYTENPSGYAYIGFKTETSRGLAFPDTKWAVPRWIYKEYKNQAELFTKAYERHIRSNAELIDSLPELAEKTLLCYCAKEECHGKVLLMLIKERRHLFPKKERVLTMEDCPVGYLLSKAATASADEHNQEQEDW